MQYNVLEYLEQTVRRVPDKVAYTNGSDELTFSAVSRQSRAIGSFLTREGLYREPVVIFMNKQPRTIVAFLGVVYGGCYYVPLDDEMPQFRIEMILQTLKPRAAICDEATAPAMRALDDSCPVYLYDDICTTPVDDRHLQQVRDRQIDTDPIYVVFTSGSTGVPKGVVACHRSVLDYIEVFSDVMSLNENTIFGMQVPLYFDACLKEVYPTLKFGATTYIIPKNLFMFPVRLVEYLNEYKINTLCWVVSALTMISAFGALAKNVPQYLTTIAFGSEVMPVRQLKLWRKALPATRFINLYGPTEATGMSCYFIVDRDFCEGDVIPIGQPFRNTEIMLLDAKNQVPPPGEPGEICIRGTALTLGYFRSFDRTAEVFVQNPLNDAWPELIYRTGDLGKYNDRGELVFISRKDYQIKHMGHRIELGEIEANVQTLDSIKLACCTYDQETAKIVLYYVGDIDPKTLMTALRQKLPRYMLPNQIEPLTAMPLTANAKIDRVALRRLTEQKKEKPHG